MVQYDILIDGGLYEGSESLETALQLYSSVDDTCLREYYGHYKGLQAREGDKTILLKSGKIGKPLLYLRIHYPGGDHKDIKERIFPEEISYYLLKAGLMATRVEILNSEGEVVTEYDSEYINRPKQLQNGNGKKETTKGAADL